MRLVTKLLDYVHSAFNKEADAFVALRVRHTSEAFSWRVSDRVLTLFDGSVVLHTIDLTTHNIVSLVNHLATLTDIAVVYMDADRHYLAASSLLDGENFQARSNGDMLMSYQSTLWMYLDALATELSEAKTRIIAMLDQMTIPTADDEWLDEWGSYFGIPRETAETDTVYGNRIIAETLRPRANNKAIEAALFQHYGQSVSVDDLVRYGSPNPGYNGAYFNNGAPFHNSTAAPLYGLFEIIIGYDLLTSGDPPSFIQSVRAFVEKMRDAGTHLDAVRLSTSEIADSYDNPPLDSGIGMTVTNQMHYDGLRYYDGSTHYDVVVTVEAL